ncbi:TIGR00159 family protein [Eubacterium nodatum ATCC 33099]|nr:TIGR00159 family protein [Eubacterium nodatum ATCC 33099]
MQNFFSNTISTIGINDILDILITTFILYKILEFIKDTRAQQLLKGLLFVIAAYFVADYMNLYVVHWILKAVFTVGLFALVVIFQPELRRGLEYMGRSKIGMSKFVKIDKDKAKYISNEIANITASFSDSRTGALIVFERDVTLEDVAETGTLINADISAELLGNLFYEGAPLHDGAVIIRQDKVYAAGCVLPLTDKISINKSLGTRHRAGIGITENSDAVTLIVSEETGIISVAKDGQIIRFLEKKNVEKILMDLFIDEDESSSKLVFWGKKLGRGKNAAK